MTYPNGIIGRKEELIILDKVFKSPKSEFLVLYGRRRVGKTFLINRVFGPHFSFRITAMSSTTFSGQLVNFMAAYNASVSDSQLLLSEAPKNWFSAFQAIIRLAEADKRPKKVIFFDELPWFDAYGADFLSALEHFWNAWASYRSDILLIGCGSAASWMINQIIHNHGGLHNRITERIALQPFTLSETEAFLQEKGGVFDRFQLLELYMVMGGIPYYLENIQVNRSVAQNIDRMFFSPNGLLRTEYDDLYRSLFKHPGKHLMIVEALAQKSKGLSRKDILAATKLPNGGTSTKVLEELEQSGFIKQYSPFGSNKRESLFQLIDPFTLFYLTFIKDSRAEGEGAWISQMDSAKWHAWSGYAFEYICRAHIQAIKRHLGISGMYTEISNWRTKKSEKGAQIDLIIDRKDHVINICEMKFSIHPFSISKSYAENLKHKLMSFRTESKTTKTLFLTLITTYGVVPNAYSAQCVQESLDMNALFD
jgi:AAA+ ATPase superfamily predicted ATPase